MWSTPDWPDRGARATWQGSLARLLLLAASLVACSSAPVPSNAELPPEGAFTLVVMPDTQGYIYNYKWDKALSAQTQWIVQNAAAHDIRYVIHLGDIVNNNRTTQWKLARGLFDVLHDGDRVKVPYALVPGNHDIGPNGLAENRWTLMTRDEYFGRGSPYGRQPSIGGYYDPTSTTNTWHEFAAGGKQWLILALEFGPRDDVVRWAGEVLASHPDHHAIVVTHAYLWGSNARYQYLPYAGSQTGNPHDYPFARGAADDDINDGEELWQKLISKHANVRLVLSGHAIEDGEGRVTSVGDHGQVVHQLMQNFQPGVYDSKFGGNGFFRLLEFWPDGKTVRVRTYSPFLGEYHTVPGHEFFLSLHDEPVGPDHVQAVFADRPLLYYRPRVDTGSSVVNRVGGRADLDGTYEGNGAGPWAFDGDDAIRTNTALPQMSAWSIEAWVRPNRRGSRQVLFTNDRPGTEMTPEGSGTDTEDALPLEFHDDVLLGIAPEGSRFTEGVSWTVVHRDKSGARTIAESPLRALANRWCHVVATADGKHLRLYVDGDLTSDVEAAAEALDLAGVPALIGRSENISGAAFDGEIGELAVYQHALSAADVIEHRMAAFSRVTAARVELTGSVDPDAEELEGVKVVEQGMPGLSVTVANRGDIQVFLGGADARNPLSDSPGGNPALSGEGVLLATVAENARSGLVGSAASSWNSWRYGIIGVSTNQIGATEEEVVVADDTEGEPEEEDDKPSVKQLYDIELTVINEVNMNVAMAWFPFRGGWRGGHVRADGALLSGNGVTQAMVRAADGAAPEDGRVVIDLGVDASADGMLFALGADGRNRVAVAGPREGGPGWEVRLQANSVRREGVERPSLEEVLDLLEIPPEEREDYEDSKLLTRDSFSFVYVPFDAANLIGGVYDGLADMSQTSTGEFTLTRLDEPGAYRLEISGHTPDTGVLVLTGADLLDARNVALTYEGDDAGAFQIRAWEVETAAPRDTVFAWAFVGFTEPVALPQ